MLVIERLDDYYTHCENPQWIKVPQISKGYFPVPCKKCLTCQTSKKIMWVNRCICESYMHKFNYFVTLTFDDDHLKDTCFKVAQKFLKSVFNFSAKIKSKFKYFGAYENGTENKRPHFHFCLFTDFDLYSIFEKSDFYGFISFSEWFSYCFWKMGFCKIEPLDTKRIAYVANYTIKKMGEFYDKELLGESESKSSETNDCFWLRSSYFIKSRGLGFSYFDKWKDRIIDGHFNVDGHSVNVPDSWYKSRGLEHLVVIGASAFKGSRRSYWNNLIYKSNFKRRLYEKKKNLEEKTFPVWYSVQKEKC